MGRTATSAGGGDFEQCPAGTHMARCVRLIDLGTQKNEWPPGSGKIKLKSQIFIGFETPDEMLETDKGMQPFVVGRFLTNSLAETSNMRPLLEGWRGRAFTDAELEGFDLGVLLGLPCLITVIHDAKGKARISSISKLMKGQECPKPHNALTSYWIEEHDQKVFDTLPEGIRKIIMRSPEYAQLAGGVAVEDAGTNTKAAGIDDDDIPFR